MLKNIINLKDIKEMALNISLVENSKELKPEHKFSKENIVKAVEVLAKAGLKYNNKNGKTYLRKEVMAEYSNKNSIPVYEDVSEVIEWELTSFILNSASRIERGLKAI